MSEDITKTHIHSGYLTSLPAPHAEAAIPVEAQPLATFRLSKSLIWPELTCRKLNVRTALIVITHATLLSAGLRTLQSPEATQSGTSARTKRHVLQSETLCVPASRTSVTLDRKPVPLAPCLSVTQLLLLF
jgi:hypothetical protein